MMQSRTYTPAELCDLFGIAKSTLFRWEVEGAIPPVRRDLKNHRTYSGEHLAVIGKRQLEAQFATAAKTENASLMATLSERLALQKFIDGNRLGLRELNELPRISFDTLRALLKTVVERCESPDDSTFNEVVAVVHRHAGTLTIGSSGRK